MNVAVLLLGVGLLVAVHEAAHVLAAVLLGRRWELFCRLPWKVGVRVEGAPSGLIAAAGPAANALLAVLLLPFPLPWGSLGMASLLLATFGSASDWAHLLRRAHQPKRSLRRASTG